MFTEVKELNENILAFLDFRSVQSLNIISSDWKQTIQSYINEKSTTRINKLKRNLDLEKLLREKLKKKCFFKEIKLHHYHYIHDDQIEFFDDSFETLTISHFTFYYNGRYHEIKIFDDYADTASGPGDFYVLFLCYGVPGFNETFKEVLFHEPIAKNLKKWIGVDHLFDEDFKLILEDFIMIYDYPEFKKNEKLVSKNQISINTYHNKEQRGKATNLKIETFEWIEDWLKEVPVYESMKEEVDEKYCDFMTRHFYMGLKEKEINMIYKDNACKLSENIELNK